MIVFDGGPPSSEPPLGPSQPELCGDVAENSTKMTFSQLFVKFPESDQPALSLRQTLGRVFDRVSRALHMDASYSRKVQGCVTILTEISDQKTGYSTGRVLPSPQGVAERRGGYPRLPRWVRQLATAIRGSHRRNNWCF